MAADSRGSAAFFFATGMNSLRPACQRVSSLSGAWNCARGAFARLPVAGRRVHRQLHAHRPEVRGDCRARDLSISLELQNLTNEPLLTYFRDDALTPRASFAPCRQVLIGLVGSF
jgi:hypothetical protein